MKRYIVFICLGISFPMSVSAQTTLNPDISVVGDMRVFSHNDHTRNSELREINLADPGMELNVSGYVNPFTHAVGIIALEQGESANIEELYLIANRGLPLGLSARVGKTLLQFGRLNSVHEHAWSFLKRPLPQTMFFTDEGLNEITVQVSRLLPTGDVYTEVMVGILQGEGLFTSEESSALVEKPDAGFFSRFTASFAVSESAELALGVSALNDVSRMDSVALNVPAELKQYRSWVIGLDAKLKDHPSRYKTLQIEGEALLRSDDTPVGHLTSFGAFGYIDYRFRQRYNVGSIFEYVDRKELTGAPGMEIELSRTIWRSGFFLGFSPVEETSIMRLEGHFTQPENQKGFWEVTAQLVFSLGPHKPHNF